MPHCVVALICKSLQSQKSYLVWSYIAWVCFFKKLQEIKPLKPLKIKSIKSEVKSAKNLKFYFVNNLIDYCYKKVNFNIAFKDFFNFFNFSVTK